MLVIYRRAKESVEFQNSINGETKIVTVKSYNFPSCTLDFDGTIIKGAMPETIRVHDISITLLYLDRGVKLGISAPKHIKVRRC